MTTVLRKAKAPERPLHRALDVTPSTWDDATRSVELVMSTGAPVPRIDWSTGTRYVEVLSMEPAHVRMGRLNAGAPLLANHSSYSLESVLGAGVAGSARCDGGKITGRVAFSTRPDVAGVVTDVRAGILRNVSLGYRVYRWEIDRTQTPEVRRAVDWEPFEVSIVAIPADAGAGVRNSTNDQAHEAELEILERGDEMTTQNNQAAPASPAVPTTTTETNEAARAEGVRLEAARQTAVRELAARHNLPELGQRWASDTSITIEAARAAALEAIAARSNATNAAAPTNPTNAAATVQVVRAEGEHLDRGFENVLLNRHNSDKYPLTAEGRSVRGISLLRMLEDLAKRGGQRVDSYDRGAIIQAGLSVRSGMHASADFAAITGNVFSKILRDQYGESPDTTQGWIRRVTRPDFKTTSVVQLGAAPSLEEVPETANIKYGTLGETSESYALKTYAKGVTLSRQAIINDDTSAFTRLPQLMGAAARRLELDLIYFGIINANPTMADSVAIFHATSHGGNLITPVLAIGSIDTMRQKIRNQTGQAGEVLNLEPKFLITSTALETTAYQLLNGQIVAAVASNVNPFVGTMTPRVEPRLGNTSNNGTANACLMVCSPSQIDTIELATLQDEPGPMISSRVSFDNFGVDYAVRYDLAAKAIDYRGMVKNTGTT